MYTRMRFHGVGFSECFCGRSHLLLERKEEVH